MKGWFKRFFAKIIPLFLCLFIVSAPLSAYALDTGFVDDERNWIDKGDTVNYNSEYFQGFSKYIVDCDEGCFYFFARFTDYRIDTESDENISLGVTVKNDVRSFYFKVDKDGIINGEKEDAEVYCNFSEASCQRRGGGIFVAFKLKNKTDRTQNNLISCEYYCGENLTYNMLDGISLDMYVPQTQKSTSDKTAKTTTRKELKVSSTKSTSSESVIDTSTKFSGTGTAANRDVNKNTDGLYNDTTQFSGSNVNSETQDSNFQNIESYESNALADIGGSYDNGNTVQTMSIHSKLLIAVFAVLFSGGVICIAIGSFNKKNAEKDQTERVEDDAE